jgi:hypothetical protein
MGMTIGRLWESFLQGIDLIALVALAIALIVHSVVSLSESILERIPPITSLSPIRPV